MNLSSKSACAAPPEPVWVDGTDGQQHSVSTYPDDRADLLSAWPVTFTTRDGLSGAAISHADGTDVAIFLS